MCGRFALFNERETKEIHEIIRELEEKQPDSIKTGEIFPTNRVPMLVMGDEHRSVEAVTWGFPHFRGSGVIINARAETAHEKPMFRKNLAMRRCLIPSTGFYEWARENKKARQKYLFKLSDDPVLYMAGLFNDFDGVRRFVILTTQANESVEDIHDRMPLVVLRAELDGWLRDPHFAREILIDQRNRPQLTRQVVV